jgi:hypothetical protein
VIEFVSYAKDNLVFIVILFIALAQALTILLTIRRERDIQELRKLADEQRLQIVELKAWLAGRNAVRPRLTNPKRETGSEPRANNPKASGPPEEAVQSRTTKDWQREKIAGLRAGLKGDASGIKEPAITPKDTPDTVQLSDLGRTTKAIIWLKEEADKSRGNETSLHGTPPAKKLG